MNRLKYILVLVVCLLAFTACMETDTENKETATQTASGTVTKTNETYGKILAVITSIDYVTRDIGLIDLDTEQKVMINATVGAELTDEYGVQTTLNQFKRGDIIRVKYSTSTNKAESVALTAEVWEYKSVTNLQMDKENKTVRRASSLYQYTDNLLILDRGADIPFEKISDADKVTIKGYKTKIWVISVDSGHGTLKLKNQDHFIDGIIEIGTNISAIITDEFVIDVPVGVVTVKLEKGTFVETKEIIIEQDKEYILDLAYLDSVVPKAGDVEFVFDTDGVKLFLNSKQRAYKDLVELPYGEYKILATKEGYEDYEETFMVDTSYLRKEIHMSPKPVDDPIVTPTQDTPVVTVTPDKTIKVSILMPIGVEVYLDGDKKGLAPIDVNLKVGTHIVTLRKDGYKATTHILEVFEGMGTMFSYPELELLQ